LVGLMSGGLVSPLPGQDDASPATRETASPEPAGIPKPWKKGLRRSVQQADSADAKAAFPPGQWTDVLKLVDPKKHAKAGDWARKDGGFEVASADSPGRLWLPVAPKGSYSLKVEFTRDSEGPLGVILAVGRRQCLVALGYHGAANGLDTVGGRRAHQNETTFQGGLVNGRRYTLEIDVRPDDDEAAITVNLDDRPWIFYRGPAAALGLNKEWGLPGRTCLGLAARCDAVFHSVKLRSSSGRVAVLGEDGG
jgi:hypothetical protein